MRRLINSRENIIEDMINGYLKLCRGKCEKVEGVHAIVKSVPRDKVSVIVGGGSGLDPWPIGYVGEGLADGAAVGNVFTAPPAKAILEATRKLPHEKGVVYVVTNHAGDVLNFELVSELAGLEGIRTRQIYIADDITSADDSNRGERRGIGGVALLTKLAGAVTEAGNSLEETDRILKKANERIGTFSVNAGKSYSPSTGEICFELPENELEYGMGFNGETGAFRETFSGAAHMADTLMEYLIKDMRLEKGSKIAVWLNGYSMTSQIELSILAGEICSNLERAGIELYDIRAERLFVTPGAQGLSVSVLKLDEELEKYYDREAEAPFFHISERR